MNEITQMIIEYASMWAPALVAVLGIIATAGGGLNNVSKAITNFKDDRTFKKIEGDLNEQLEVNKQLVGEIKELRKTVSYLTDKVYHINGYVEAKKREERQKRYDHGNNKEV